MYNVMLVDDSKTFILLLTELIEKIDLKINLTTCNNGSEAKLKIIQKKLDVIITDICMPEVDGYELIQYIQSKSKAKIIAISSSNFGNKSTAVTLDIAKILGADSIICKSKVVDDFAKIIISLLLNQSNK